MVDFSKPVQLRCGGAVKIYDTTLPGHCPIVGAYESANGRWTVCRWKDNGGFYESGTTGPLDLVQLPVKVKLVRYLNIYKTNDGMVWNTSHPTKKAADLASGGWRFACIKLDLDITEGEGL